MEKEKGEDNLFLLDYIIVFILSLLYKKGEYCIYILFTFLWKYVSLKIYTYYT